MKITRCSRAEIVGLKNRVFSFCYQYAYFWGVYLYGTEPFRKILQKNLVRGYYNACTPVSEMQLAHPQFNGRTRSYF